jgi:hypothetical protein
VDESGKGRSDRRSTAVSASPTKNRMELNAWTRQLRSLYDKAVALQRAGQTDMASYLSKEEIAFLASIGLKPIHVYDFAEDFARGGEPDWDTFLLVAAVRRDFFLSEQRGVSQAAELDPAELPARKAKLGGIEWLPRLLTKATCFLEGSLSRDVMYCCGGDRNFFRKHHVHPADFLREVWAAKGDEERVLTYVRQAGPRP